MKIEDVISDYLHVSHGLPLGSILGSTLFLVFVNDLCDLELPNGRRTSFADGVTLTIDLV